MSASCIIQNCLTDVRMKVLRGSTLHVRKASPRHEFRYHADFLLMPLPRPTERISKIFAFDKWSLISHHLKDHGFLPNGWEWFLRVADELGFRDQIDSGEWRTWLLSQPRILGLGFNPVSFWLIADQNSSLRAVLAEVNNTFGERHCYFCKTDNFTPITPDDLIVVDKAFHVSPFQPVKGSYSFRFHIDSHQVDFVVDYTSEQNRGVFTTLEGSLKKASCKEAVRMFLRRPLGGLGILTLIHLQALKIWLKRATLYNKPLPPKEEITSPKN